VPSPEMPGANLQPSASSRENRGNAIPRPAEQTRTYIEWHNCR
jgi:hypothetical protein